MVLAVKGSLNTMDGRPLPFTNGKGDDVADVEIIDGHKLLMAVSGDSSVGCEATSLRMTWFVGECWGVKRQGAACCAPSLWERGGG